MLLVSCLKVTTTFSHFAATLHYQHKSKHKIKTRFTLSSSKHTIFSYRKIITCDVSGLTFLSSWHQKSCENFSQSNQFRMDKIKSCPKSFLVEYPVSYGLRTAFHFDFNRWHAVTVKATFQRYKLRVVLKRNEPAAQSDVIWSELLQWNHFLSLLAWLCLKSARSLKASNMTDASWEQICDGYMQHNHVRRNRSTKN